MVGLQWGRLRVRSGDLTLVQFPSADVSKADFAEYDGEFGKGGIEPPQPNISP